jgi:PmbA protein
MDFKMLGQQIIKKAKKLGADEAEAYFERVKSFEVTVRKGEIETLQRSTSKGLGLRVFINKQFGFSSTSDLSEPSLEDIVTKTVELARITESKTENGLPDFGPQTPPDLDLFDQEAAGIPDEKKISIARDVERIALSLDKRITNSDGGSFSNTEREVTLINSKGLSHSYQETRFSFSVFILVGQGDNMQSGGWSSSKRFFKELDPLEVVAGKAVSRAVEQLGPKPVPTKKVPVIFDHYGAPSFWMGILFSLNGDSAFRKTTFMSNHLDKAIASPLVTVADDPTRPRFVASTPFDGEGNINTRNLIIDKGILKTFIYDSTSARKAGVKAHTTARREGFQSRPYASFLTIMIENGKEKLESILTDMKEGLYVKGMRGLGTDPTTGSFSVGCNGFWIENGAKAFPVDGVTLGGSTLEILKSIDRVADDLELRGSVNSPSFRVTEMTVGGKRG